jgi:hypothetical protein
MRAIQAVQQAGLEVWKKLDLTRLVLAHGEYKGEQVRCTIVTSMVDGSTTITAESDGLDEKALTLILSRLHVEQKALLT